MNGSFGVKSRVSLHLLLSLLPSLPMFIFFLKGDHLDSLKNNVSSSYLCAHFCVMRSANGKLQILIERMYLVHCPIAMG